MEQIVVLVNQRVLLHLNQYLAESHKEVPPAVAFLEVMVMVPTGLKPQCSYRSSGWESVYQADI